VPSSASEGVSYGASDVPSSVTCHSPDPSAFDSHTLLSLANVSVSAKAGDTALMSAARVTAAAIAKVLVVTTRP
jgi:hypothetical protein